MKRVLFPVLSTLILLASGAQPATAHGKPTEAEKLLVEAAPSFGVGCQKDEHCSSGECIPVDPKDAVGDYWGTCAIGRVIYFDDVVRGPEVVRGSIHLPENGTIVIVACHGEIETTLPAFTCYEDVVDGSEVVPGCIYLAEDSVITTFTCTDPE